MPLVEGVRGPDPVRWCDCGEYTLQLVGSHYGYDEHGDATKEPVAYSHYPLQCPVCADEIRTGELILDERIAA